MSAAHVFHREPLRPDSQYGDIWAELEMLENVTWRRPARWAGYFGSLDSSFMVCLPLYLY